MGFGCDMQDSGTWLRKHLNLTKHSVKAFTYIFNKKADYPNAVSLKQSILMSGLTVERDIRNKL